MFLQQEGFLLVNETVFALHGISRSQTYTTSITYKTQKQAYWQSFIEDSSDGPGLNNSENSNGSHRQNSGELFG